MIKYVKMDMYRLLRSKVTYVIILVMVAMITLTCVVSRVTASLVNEVKNDSEAMSELSDSDREDLDNMTNQLMNASEKELNVFEEALDFSTGKTLLLLVTIFVVVFSCAERTHGYIKNMVGKNKFRSKLILSKLVIAGIYVAIMMIICYLATALADMFIRQNPLDWSVSTMQIEALIVQFMLNMTIVAGLLLVISLVDGTAIPMVVGLLISLGATGLAYAGISTLVEKVTKIEDFSLVDYLPSGQFSKVIGTADQTQIMESAGIALAFGAVFLLITCIISEKKDIR